MALKFKVGDSVAQVVKPIVGKINGVIIRDDDVAFMVGYVGEDGEQHERPFSEDEIEAAKEAEPENAEPEKSAPAKK